MTDETRVTQARPSMFRNRPVRFLLLVFLAIVGCTMRSGTTNPSDTTTANVFIFLPVGVLAIWYLSTLTTRLIVTTKRTTLRQGILAKRTREVRHSDVRLLEVRQGVLQRLFGVGTLAVASSGHGAVEIQIDGITNPERVKRAIDQHRE